MRCLRYYLGATLVFIFPLLLRESEIVLYFMDGVGKVGSVLMNANMMNMRSLYMMNPEQSPMLSFCIALVGVSSTKLILKALKVMSGLQKV